VGKLTQNLERAADQAERLSKALHNLPQAGAFSDGTGGGGGGGGGAPSGPPIVFQTNIVSRPEGRTVRMGDGSGTGGRDIQSRAFAYFGLSSAGASKAFIAQIIKAFEEMLAKGALNARTGSGGGG